MHNLNTIASYEVDVLVLVQKLYSRGAINRYVYRHASDRLTGQSNDERLQYLLHTITTTVRYNGDQFAKVLISLKECGQYELVYKLTCDYSKWYTCINIKSTLTRVSNSKLPPVYKVTCENGDNGDYKNRHTIHNN